MSYPGSHAVLKPHGLDVKMIMENFRSSDAGFNGIMWSRVISGVKIPRIPLPQPPDSLSCWHLMPNVEHQMRPANHRISSVIKWKHLPCYWPLVRGIHRSPMDSPHQGQWCRVKLHLGKATVIRKYDFGINFMIDTKSILTDNTLRYIVQDILGEKSALIQIMALYHMTTSHCIDYVDQDPWHLMVSPGLSELTHKQLEIAACILNTAFGISILSAD